MPNKRNGWSAASFANSNLQMGFTVMGLAEQFGQYHNCTEKLLIFSIWNFSKQLFWVRHNWSQFRIVPHPSFHFKWLSFIFLPCTLSLLYIQCHCHARKKPIPVLSMPMASVHFQRSSETGENSSDECRRWRIQSMKHCLNLIHYHS